MCHATQASLAAQGLKSNRPRVWSRAPGDLRGSPNSRMSLLFGGPAPLRYLSFKKAAIVSP